MGILENQGNEGAERFLKNELAKNKESGTYLFYGRKGVNIERYGLEFAMALNCEEVENDFCGKCKSCKEIERGIFPDLEIVNPENGMIGVDRIREVIYKAGTSSYSGSKKIILLTDVAKLRKEAANALLKTIEEPRPGTFFILNSHTMNILSTIKSRSTLVTFFPMNAEKTGVNQEIFELLEGNVEDIRNLESGIEESEIESKSFKDALADYFAERSGKNKIILAKSATEFINKIKFVSMADRLRRAEEVEKYLSKGRDFIAEIMHLLILKSIRAGRTDNLETLLEIKNSLGYNVNGSVALYLFFIEL
jgi:DNA polymerase III subunit delta'